MIETVATDAVALAPGAIDAVPFTVLPFIEFNVAVHFIPCSARAPTGLNPVHAPPTAKHPRAAAIATVDRLCMSKHLHAVKVIGYLVTSGSATDVRRA